MQAIHALKKIKAVIYIIIYLCMWIFYFVTLVSLPLLYLCFCLKTSWTSLWSIFKGIPLKMSWGFSPFEVAKICITFLQTIHFAFLKFFYSGAC